MRLAVIDHAAHRLYVEDVSEELIESKYNGNEEDYIKDNYTFEGEWSWDYIIDAEYVNEEGDIYDIDFENL